MNKFFISVVIPLYNKAPFILRAINSVLNQIYDHFEIIVVDDGSTDGGGNLVEKIIDPRIKLIKQENAGASSARNLGIIKAKYEFISFLDADDEWKESFLSELSNLISNFPNCVLYAQSYEINDGKRVYKPKIFSKFSKQYVGILDNYLALASLGQPFNSSSICIRKNALEKIGGFPVDLKLGEDLLVWLNLFFLGDFAFCNSFNSIYYFDNPDSTSIKLRDSYGLLELKIEEYMRFNKNKIQVWRDLNEFYTSRILIICTQELILGHQRNCRYLLSKCKDTKKFRLRWIMKFSLSLLPKKIVKFLYKSIKGKN